MKDIQILQREYVAGLTGIADAKGAISCPAASFWPYKFVLGLLKKCLDMGATLQTHTAVTKVSKDMESQQFLRRLEATSGRKRSSLPRMVISPLCCHNMLTWSYLSEAPHATLQQKVCKICHT